MGDLQITPIIIYTHNDPEESIQSENDVSVFILTGKLGYGKTTLLSGVVVTGNLKKNENLKLKEARYVYLLRHTLLWPITRNWLHATN